MKKPILKFEHHREPLISSSQFYRRQLNNTLLALGIILFSLVIGVTGYMCLGNLKFVDALLNASMILGGMGPVDVMTTDAAKYFASFYALYSGVVLLSTVAILFAPVVHRILHRFHLQTEEDEEKNESKDKSRN